MYFLQVRLMKFYTDCTFSVCNSKAKLSLSSKQAPENISKDIFIFLYFYLKNVYVDYIVFLYADLPYSRLQSFQNVQSI